LSGTREFIWLDGGLVPAGDARVSVKTHSLHYGTAVFEGIRGYYNSDQLFVFRLREHCERLIASGGMIHLDIPFSAGDIFRGVIELLRRNGFRRSVYIRPIAFVGEGDIRLDFRKHPKQVAIFAVPFDAYFERSGLRVCISSWRRVSQSSMIPRSKAAGNYLNSSVATIEAKLAGYDEALLLDEEGRVSEGPGQNLFMVSGGALVTPPVYSAILEGITRQTVITIAKESGREVQERPIDRSELYTAEEVFLTGTAAGIEAVLEIDGREVSGAQPGKVTKNLEASYSDIVTGRSTRHASWLTPVYETT